MRRVPRNYPTIPLLHFGNESLGRNCTIEIGVARPEYSADMKCDTFLETGMHRWPDLRPPFLQRWHFGNASPPWNAPHSLFMRWTPSKNLETREGRGGAFGARRASWSPSRSKWRAGSATLVCNATRSYMTVTSSLNQLSSCGYSGMRRTTLSSTQAIVA